MGFGEPLTYLTRPLAWTAPWLRPMRFSRAKTPKVKQREVALVLPLVLAEMVAFLVPRRTEPRSWEGPFYPSRRLAGFDDVGSSSTSCVVSPSFRAVVAFGP